MLQKTKREAVLCYALVFWVKICKNRPLNKYCIFQKDIQKIRFVFMQEKKQKEFDKAYEEAKKTENALFLVPIQKKTIQYCRENHIQFSIFVCLDSCKNSTIIPCLTNSGILIANIDDKRVFPLQIKKENQLITYGLNHKASVTVSSLLEPMGHETKSKIQCCIQKNIQTVSGNIFEPQEFSLFFLKEGQKSISGALAAITALMAADVQISGG